MATYQSFGMIRDKDGKPSIDDPSTLHPAQIFLLTDQERADLGLWRGAFLRDAQGWKRVEEQPDGTFIAIDPIVAAQEIFIANGKCYAITPRCDILAGETIIVNIGE